jgi:hypothetical protein
MNDYSTATSRLASELQAGLVGKYTGLVTARQVFKPDRLPSSFTRYGIVVSPHARPWDERRISNLAVQYVFRVDLYALVANYDEANSLFGDTTPNFGLFELVNDIKDLLRVTDLSGLLDKTYDEAAGDPRVNGGGGVEFGDLATPALDTGTQIVVQRAKIPFVGRTDGFCHPRVP